MTLGVGDGESLVRVFVAAAVVPACREGEKDCGWGDYLGLGSEVGWPLELWVRVCVGMDRGLGTGSRLG